MTVRTAAGVEEAALDAVDWLAALWDAGAPGPSQAVNAHLLTLVNLSPDIPSHDAALWVERQRRTSSRDQLVKRVVSATYRPADGDTGVESLRRFGRDVEPILGPAAYRVVCEARAQVRAGVDGLIRGLDPVGDVAALTREPLQLRIAFGPSIFLPPPPSGRHGVLVQRQSAFVAHLYFGFPVARDPEEYNITHAWIMGGAWHYALRLCMDRDWPPVASHLSTCTALAEPISALLEASGRSHDAGPGDARWIRWLAQHVHLALKSLLCRRHGEPADAFRILAELRGYTLYPWFEAWLTRGLSRNESLSDVLATLPASLRHDRVEWEALTVREWIPPTINFALASHSARRAVLVFPDAWSEAAVREAAVNWGFLPMRVARYSEWLPLSETDTAPVVAVGEPEQNAIVRAVLDQRRLAWPPRLSDNAAIVALSAERVAGAAWCLAVAVSGPKTAVGLRASTFVNRFNTYVLFDHGVVIGDNRVVT